MNRHAAPEFPRLRWLHVGLNVALLVLCVRLGWLTVVDTGTDDAVGAGEIRPERGAIWDRDGDLLATQSYDRHEVTLDLTLVEDPAGFVAELARILGSDAQQLSQMMETARQRGTRWISVARYADLRAAERLRAMDHAAVTVRDHPTRTYPLGMAAAHVTGFVTEDGKGHYGVEGHYNDMLTGQPGRPPGRTRRDPTLFRMPIDGHDVVTTIDRDIQLQAWRAIERVVETENATGGSAVVIAPRTGDILALVGWPSFDPNHFSAYDPENFVNGAIASGYPPGSVIKPVTLASAIDLGIVSPDSTYEDAAQVVYAGVTVPNPDHMAHGTTTMTEMLVLSLNVGALQVADWMGPERFYDGIQRFGFGRRTGVDLPHEMEGIVHTPGDPSWSKSVFAFNSYGQSIDASVLQMASAIATLANDGRRVRPRVVRSRLAPTGEVIEHPPETVTQAVAPSTARAVRRMLASVVQDRVTEAAVPGYSVAGKTGTSEISGPPGSEENDLIASFCGMIPVERPELVICVRVDRPDGERGSRVAAPIFHDLATNAVEILGIPPTDAAEIASVTHPPGVAP